MPELRSGERNEPVSQTILLVEDNEDNQTIYREVLEHLGCRVLVAGDGERGVPMARESIPDAILMDVSMPVINGLEATRILKADPSTSQIPIIILTANAMVENRDSAFAAGGDAFLGKPVKPLAEAEEIRRLLTGTPGRRPLGGARLVVARGASDCLRRPASEDYPRRVSSARG